MEAPVTFSLIRLLILHLHILHFLYLHILHLENSLYFAIPTHLLHYIATLDSESETRYVRHLNLEI